MRNKFIIIETTYPNLADAKKLGETLLNKKLAACVQFSEIESSYFWQDKIETSCEVLVKIKSKKSLFDEISETINKHHNYETPQILASEVCKGSTAYLSWIDSNLRRDK